MKKFPLILAFLVGTATACAATNLELVPELKARTLQIAADFAGFEYQYEVCVSHFIWCTKKEMRRDTYDLTKKETRDQLRAMGFIARVRER